MNRRHIGKWLENNGLFILLLLFLLAAWETAARLGIVPSFILPAPSAIGVSLAEESGLLLGTHLPATLKEVGIGFAASLLLGTLLAGLMHASRRLEKALYPFIIISQTIPLVAISPVFILWFGYTVWAKAAIVFLTAFFPIVVGAYDGLKKGGGEYAELLRTMGAGRWAIACKVQVPLALPSFFSGLKLSVVYCVVGATVGEWLGGTEGLGYFSRRMSGNLNTGAMFASVLLLSLLGMVLFAAVALLERLILRKRGIAE